MEDKCKYSGRDPKSFLSLDEVLKMDDISGENGRFVRVITAANGKKAFLRIYKDNHVYPYESQISTALKRCFKRLRWWVRYRAQGKEWDGYGRERVWNFCLQ